MLILPPKKKLQIGSKEPKNQQNLSYARGLLEAHCYMLYFAWVISLMAILTSFYYSEVLQFEPCRLCWYQRMGYFPLSFFLAIAAYKEDQKMASYCLPFVLFGGAFAMYQCLTVLFPALHSSALCGAAGYCSDSGAFPFFSLMGFSTIAFLILLYKRLET